MKTKARSLFRSVPEDCFHFFDKRGGPQGKNIVDFLEYSKKDVSTATGVSLESVRYDDKMPAILKKRLSEWATAINLVDSYFKDSSKTVQWFRIPNPQLGGIRPEEMIQRGRCDKLIRFIQVALEENLDPKN